MSYDETKKDGESKDRTPLKCDLPPDVALKRVMIVKVPDYWTRPAKVKNTKKR